MRINFLIIIILAIIASINSYDYSLQSGVEQYLGTLTSGVTYTFYIEAKTGQDVEITLTTTSTNVGTSFSVYAYISGQSSYAFKNDFIFAKNGTTLYKKLNVQYATQDSEQKLIKYIVLEYKPLYTISNTRILATVTGESLEKALTSIVVTILLIIFIPILLCIIITITICCCCCCNPKPKIVVQNPTTQPLYPVNQPYQQPPPVSYAPPYP